MIRFFCVAALVANATPALADPLAGVWQTEVDDGAYAHIAIDRCGSNFCGVIARTFRDGAEFVSPNAGKMLVIDMAPTGDGQYRGQVWRPSNDKIYVGKISLDGDRIKLSGCVAGGLICSRQTWARVE